MHRSALASVLVSLLAPAMACDGTEYAILLEAWPEGEAGLVGGAALDVFVQDLRDRRVVRAPQVDLVDGLAGSEPLRIAVELSRPGQVLVHVVAVDVERIYAASRCYSVVGMTRSEVSLADITEGDLDRDGWSAAVTCGGPDPERCRNLCPPPIGLDCDDQDGETFPGADDACADGRDQDCDGVDVACTDDDGDGFAECAPDATERSCDCDDTNPDVHPAVQETETPGPDQLCENGTDDDCDGVDLRCDQDADGWSSCPPGEPGPSCDCADDDPAVYPGASETPGGLCDGQDNNCNGAVDEVGDCLPDDLDGDGARAACEPGEVDCVPDCNDCNAGMAPRNAPRCGNRIDEDCTLGGLADGSWLAEGVDACPAGDADEDGYPSAAVGGTDCDDADPTIYPGAPDACGGSSQDCTGVDTTCEADQDLDGWNAANDCDDTVAAVHPGVPDGCDGVDEDCDGVVDEVERESLGCVRLPRVAEVDFGASLLNCGGCRRDCNSACTDGTLCQADACRGGTCSCAGQDACDGSRQDTCCPDGCRDTTADPLHCGGCGTRCRAEACRAAVCRDGACDTEALADGTRCGGGLVCCGGECVGSCSPGAVEQRECGDCGLESRTCGADCGWDDWGGCRDEGTCTPLETEQRGCGNCGRQERACGLGCGWGAWAICSGEGVCAPGQVETEPCGNCGTRTRTCSDACQWNPWGACTGEGACAPGLDESEGCGNCGTRGRECSVTCQWSAWSGCVGEGVCAAGDGETAACGNCGSRARSCQVDCNWEPWGACAGEGCAPGAVEQLACGNCGNQTRTCDFQCTWSGWSICTDEGACVPGDVEAQACGICGTEARTCAADCTWGAYEACVEGGECAPDATEACGNCGTRTCAATCLWAGCVEPPGSCTPGTIETRACPAAGPQQSRTCGADCLWGLWEPACP